MPKTPLSGSHSKDDPFNAPPAALSASPRFPALSTPASGYIIAIAAVVVATLVRWLLNPVLGRTALPYATYFAAILFVAWSTQLGPSLLALALGGCAASFIFFEPQYSFALPNTHTAATWVSFAVYAIVGLGICCICESLRRAVTDRNRSNQDHSQLAAIVESSEDAIISKNLNGIIRSWNRGAERLFGYTAQEAIGKHITMLIPPDRVNEEPGILARIRGGESVEHYETVRRRKDDTLVNISLTVSPVINAAGTIVGASKIARDITERKRHEDQLAELSEQYRLVTDAAPALISYVSADGRYRFVNKGYEDWFGYRREDVVGKEMREVLGPAAFEQLRPHVESALRGEREAFEAEIPYKDGVTRFIHAEYVPDIKQDKSVVGFHVMVTDITHNKRAEQALRAAKEAAETANIAKDNFLATLSHELRTPLTPVLTTLGMWEEAAEFPPELRDDLQMIRRNVDLEARLIDDLLDITRIVKGKLALNMEVMNVQKLLDSVVGMYKSEISAKKIELTQTSHATHCFVRADPGRLQQAFWNLLKNAVKFTDEGGKIEVATRNDAYDGAHPRQIQIIVRDTGLGISTAMLSRLFTPFEQENIDHIKRYGGLGLGLSITKQLLEAQRGQITAQSEGRDRGATFVITLQCVEKPIHASHQLGDASGAPSTAGSGNVNNAEGHKCLRVLLVEDHRDTARMLSRLLQMKGHQVTMAHSVADAVAALRDDEVFDVLVSDIGLPDGTGIDLIHQLRQEHGLKAPAIALTGFGMEDDIARCHEAGFTHHLTKPVNFRTLEETIQRITTNDACIECP